MTTDGAATVEALRAELARAKEQARSSNAAALKAAEELKAEKAAHCESQEKMAKMAVELKYTADRCRVLEKEKQAKATELEKATAADKDTRSAMRAKKEELQEAGDIAAGKPFMLRRKFGDPRYAPLDRLWSSTDAYMDLAASAADAAKYFQGQTDHEVDKLFWTQFHVPERPLSFTDQLAEWAELNRLSGLAMRSVVDQLWPEGPKPDSYFSLVQQLLDAVPRINAMKRSVCIEGSRMALARVKAYWAEMDATTIEAQGSAIGRVAAEHYFEEVLEGARLIEAQCSKILCLSDMYSHCKHNAFMKFL